MRDSDPPEGFRQTEYLLETLAAFRQCVEWSRLGYRERRFAELKLTFVGPERKPATDPKLPFKFLQSSPSLGPASFRFCICEAAVHGKQLSARRRRPGPAVEGPQQTGCGHSDLETE